MEGRDTTEKIATEPALDDGEDCDCNGEAVSKVEIGSYKAKVEMITDPAEEILLLWAFQQPTFSKPNAFVHHSSVDLHLDACGHRLSIFQTPSSMSMPGVTGAVMWDSGVVLGKFLEHAVDMGRLAFQCKKTVELGSGCGLVGCIAALLGAEVVLTDLHDRLKLLKKNVDTNLDAGKLRSSATVSELTWGDTVETELIQPSPDFILGSDVIYSEAAVSELVSTLTQLSGRETTIFLAGELRNDAVLEYFLDVAMEFFQIGHVDQTQWHPDYCSRRVAIFVLVKKTSNFKN
ncbi:S-adenosylmethionine-dependent methyltransferase domain-containingprotein [Zostera marina]|uniref:S-adenosylmethionine-dependent methyltransferase domain-containingprotein n=1 Tax=Zostera marina TaxID=29655 RepID=A0A0K9P4U7_ZOSMR|nr:S-adenosylmethionine-dependent methyltransferase domain-containingprotein [Zostera marina]